MIISYSRIGSVNNGIVIVTWGHVGMVMPYSYTDSFGNGNDIPSYEFI